MIHYKKKVIIDRVVGALSHIGVKRAEIHFTAVVYDQPTNYIILVMQNGKRHYKPIDSRKSCLHIIDDVVNNFLLEQL